MKKLVLARYGGLSTVKQKHYQKNEKNMDFHTAPEKYGIYAFLWPYIDWFLLTGDTGKMRKVENPKNKFDSLTVKYRKFKVSGPVWTHMNIPPKYQPFIIEEKGSWVKIHSDLIYEILSKDIVERKKELKSDIFFNKKSQEIPKVFSLWAELTSFSFYVIISLCI